MASADPPLSHREAKRILKDEGKAAPAVVSPPATVPSAPDNEVQKDIVIGALVAAVQTLIGTLPQAGPPATCASVIQTLACLPARRRGDNYTAERKHRHSGCGIPYCIGCGDSETLDHLLLECPAGDASRQVMLTVYGELGLPRATSQHLLFPACRREHIKRALSALLDFVDGSGLRERI
ncbi:hypothetical protein MTO96_049732 [Rhipicephalus appendiculatus]